MTLANDRMPQGVTRDPSQRMALDRATVRMTDQDGRLHIEISPISKANVCPYYGSEIPQSEAMGLKADQVYQLLRDPVELAKAAPTFNNIPLLNQHIPVNAADPQKDSVVGATGSNATFTPPYLTNSLVIWDASSIAGIETGEQKELSSSYRYVADMTPGEFEGVAYDGRMTNIIGNHVALVPAGRAGADVVVGDSLPPEFPMKLSKKSVAMRAALGAYLRPILAQDGALPATRVLVKPGHKAERIAADAKTMFAAKADIDATKLAAVLQLACDEADQDDMEGAEDEEEESDEDKAARLKKEAAKDKKAKDAEKDDKDDKDDDKAEDEDDKDDDKKDDRKASDAALIQRGRDAAMGDFKALRQAERDVQPLVGEVVAMDSAEAVYRFALDAAGVDAKGVHASALPALVKLATERKNTTSPRVAMDSAASDDFKTRFPTASKIARA